MWLFCFGGFVGQSSPSVVFGATSCSGPGLVSVYCNFVGFHWAALFAAQQNGWFLSGQFLCLILFLVLRVDLPPPPRMTCRVRTRCSFLCWLTHQRLISILGLVCPFLAVFEGCSTLVGSVSCG